MVLCKKFATKCCVYLPKIANCLNCRKRYIQVSISQSRYFSFQPLVGFTFTTSEATGFNLAIEILFFSTIERPAITTSEDMFQSRNRDTFLFNRKGDKVSNRWIFTEVSISQSRYFSFQPYQPEHSKNLDTTGFNLAIEILFFSTAIYWNSDDTCRRGCYFCEWRFLSWQKERQKIR